MPSPTPAPIPHSGASGWMWDAFNVFAIYIEDTVALLWPTTPSSLKLSTLLGGAVSAYPSAPWFLIHDAAILIPTALTMIVFVKAVKIFWP